MVVNCVARVPAKQTGIVFASKEPPELDEGAHAGKSTFAAMAMAKQPKHGDLMPKS